MKPKLLLGIFLFIFLTLGCAQKKTLVGTWDMPIPPDWGVKDGTLKVEFKPDNTLEGKGEYLKAKAILKGVYETKDNSLSVTFSDVSFDTENSDLPPIAFELMKGQVEKQLKKPIEGKIEWKNDNEVLFTTTQGGPALTLKRVGAQS